MITIAAAIFTFTMIAVAWTIAITTARKPAK